MRSSQDVVAVRLVSARAEVVRAHARVERCRRAYLASQERRGREEYYQALDALARAQQALALARGEAHISGVAPSMLHAVWR